MAPIIPVQEAVEYLRSCGMRTSPETLRYGIVQGVFSFGDCVEMESPPDEKKKYTYYIYTHLLAEWAKERGLEASSNIESEEAT